MEKITNVEIKNFKSIRDAEIKDCRKVNVFVGPPNVGKSNILEALGLFCFNENVEFKQLIRAKEKTTLFFNGEINIDFSVCVNENFIIKTTYIDDDVRFNYSSKSFNYNPIDFTENQFSNFKLIDFNSIRKGYDALQIKEWMSNKVFPIKKYEFTKEFKKIDGNYKSLIFPFGNNIFSTISANKKIYDDIIGLFQIYNLELLFDSRKMEYSILRRTEKGIFSLPYDLIADTLQRLIFYKTAVMSNIETILLFEEPEANCYEPYIMEITNAIKNDENDNQFFIVTHSQYVIDELMRDKEYRENVNIYLVGLNYNNETELKLLKPEVSEENYQTGLNVFFNFNSLWNEN